MGVRQRAYHGLKMNPKKASYQAKGEQDNGEGHWKESILTGQQRVRVDGETVISGNGGRMATARGGGGQRHHVSGSETMIATATFPIARACIECASSAIGNTCSN